MDNYFYFSSIRKTTVGFLDVFNSMQIKRINEKGELVRMVDVPIKLAPKSKFYSYVFNKKNERYLPMFGTTMTSLDKDESRIGDVAYEIVKKKVIEKENEENVEKIIKILNPVPYNFGYQLNIATLLMSDLDQILEQILPFFNSNAFYRITYDEFDLNFNIRLKLGGISLNNSPEVGLEETKICSATLDFVAESYIFYPLKSTDVIEKIIIPYYTKKLPDNFEKLTVNENKHQLEGPYIKGKETQFFKGIITDDDKKIITYETFMGDGVE